MNFYLHTLSFNEKYQHHPYWDIDAMLAWFPDPISYPPWQEFGLGTIPVKLLRKRAREFLISTAHIIGSGRPGYQLTATPTSSTTLDRRL